MWDLLDIKWEESFAQLQQFVNQHGHALVPAKYTAPDGGKLGQWVIFQRSRKARLSPERRRRLEGIKGWIWHTGQAAWEQQYVRLQQFVNQHGHALV